MPTRRVALDGAYLPTSGPAHGAALLAAVVATNLPAIEEEGRERGIALDAIRQVVDGRWSGLAPDVEIRVVSEAMFNGIRPPLAAAGEWKQGAPPEELLWRGVGPDQRWAMEVLGLRAGMDI